MKCKNTRSSGNTLEVAPLVTAVKCQPCQRLQMRAVSHTCLGLVYYASPISCYAQATMCLAKRQVNEIKTRRTSRYAWLTVTQRGKTIFYETVHLLDDRCHKI